MQLSSDGKRPYAVTSTAKECLVDGAPWKFGLLVDLGSTFTKLTVVDEAGQLIARSQSPTTVDGEAIDGLIKALGRLPGTVRTSLAWAMCSSSAAGGLRIASVGLTSRLSGEAARLASLGAGGKLVRAQDGYLDAGAARLLLDASPHLIVMTGGLDGGNNSALLHNAEVLSGLSGVPAFVVAGNQAVADRATGTLRSRGHDALTVANVYPTPGTIEIGPLREAVRELFLRHITHAKGLDTVLEVLKAECEPTPLSVSRGLETVASQEDRPVMLVDVGGATTDIHSVGGDQHRTRGVDLPQPMVLRTVEGDLGVRAGAVNVIKSVPSRLRVAHEAELKIDLMDQAEKRGLNPRFVPATRLQERVDEFIARTAVNLGIERHAGKIIINHRPWGTRHRAQGKDLRKCSLLIATGGVFCHMHKPESMIRNALSDVDAELSPTDPRIVVDHAYLFYAVGLVARLNRRLGMRMINKWRATPAASVNEVTY